MGFFVVNFYAKLYDPIIRSRAMIIAAFVTSYNISHNYFWWCLHKPWVFAYMKRIKLLESNPGPYCVEASILTTNNQPAKCFESLPCYIYKDKCYIRIHWIKFEMITWFINMSAVEKFVNKTSLLIMFIKYSEDGEKTCCNFLSTYLVVVGGSFQISSNPL